MRSQVFLRAYVVVDRPFAEVEAGMAAGAQNWLPGMATAANGNGQRLLSELGFDLGQHRVGRRITVEIEPATGTPGLTFIPIRWRAASDSAMFPTLEGELEVAALGSGTTQLALSANYEPPLGLLGRLADRAVFHRVAEVTVHDFLARVAARLEQGKP